jgi:hypothetical protein
MEKDFDRWNERKKRIDRHDDEILFHEREIWWSSLGVNVGSEQDGIAANFERPVLKPWSRDQRPTGLHRTATGSTCFRSRRGR